MGDKLVGQPCTRTDQCAAKLICSGGSCVEVDRDAGNRDASVDDDASTHAAVRK
jgi:hypothetical protein